MRANMNANMNVNLTPQLRLLTEDQIGEIHSASLEILETTGVEVGDVEAQGLLLDYGCRILDGHWMTIPSHLVEDALRSAPKRIVLGNRDGARKVVLEGYRFYFGTGSDCPNLIDLDSGERRKWTKKDVGDAARLCDALPNIDFVMSMGLISDVSPERYFQHQFAAMVSNTVKPVVFTCANRNCLADILEICVAIAGSEEAYRGNPFAALYAEPLSPLRHPQTSLEKVLFAADHEIPTVYTPGLMAGGTAPVTLAGALAVGNAELLSGLTIFQLRRRGAPFIYGGVFTVMDMRSTIFSYGAPEFLLMNMALADLGHHYGLPIFGTAGCTDSKALDLQAGIEGGMSVLVGALCGANLIHDVGYIEYGLTGAYEMLVASDEAIGMAKRILRGIEINEHTLALDVVRSAARSGNFLDTNHTFEHFRSELWMPGLMDRDHYLAWTDKGRKTMATRCAERARGILATYEAPSLKPSAQKEIERILARL